MARAASNKFVQVLYPSLEGWHDQEISMWPILMKHLEPVWRRKPLADVLLAAYLLGLNHMIEVTDKNPPCAELDKGKP